MNRTENYTPTNFMLPTSTYDQHKADYAVGFIECLTHTKGTWAGQPFHSTIPALITTINSIRSERLTLSS